jgi:AcrR family transcriptional regulator
MAHKEHGKELRDQILQTTQEVIYEHHLSGMTIRKVAERLEISPALVMYYFPTKQDLIHAVVDDLIRFFNEELDDLIKDSKISPEKKLMLMLYREVEFITRGREELIILDFWVQSNSDEAIHEKMRTIYANWERQNNLVIQEGIDKKVFDPVQAGWVSRFLISFITGAVVQYGNYPESFDLHGYFDQVYKVLMRILQDPEVELEGLSLIDLGD